MNKVLKSGFLVPPLMVNWTWKARGKTNREIWFYPFIPRENLSGYRLSSTARQANYQMFDYQRLQSLPHLVLYENRADRG